MTERSLPNCDVGSVTITRIALLRETPAEQPGPNQGPPICTARTTLSRILERSTLLIESLPTCEAAAKKAAHDGRAGSPIFGAYAMDREQATFFLLLSSIF